MDITDSELWINRDWDPVYLSDIFEEEFDDIESLWSSDVNDLELVSYIENMEKYIPIVEDISLDDDLLCSAVEQIEEE